MVAYFFGLRTSGQANPSSQQSARLVAAPLEAVMRPERLPPHKAFFGVLGICVLVWGAIYVVAEGIAAAARWLLP